MSLHKHTLSRKIVCCFCARGPISSFFKDAHIYTIMVRLHFNTSYVAGVSFSEQILGIRVVLGTVTVGPEFRIGDISVATTGCIENVFNFAQPTLYRYNLRATEFDELGFF